MRPFVADWAPLKRLRMSVNLALEGQISLTLIPSIASASTGSPANRVEVR